MRARIRMGLGVGLCALVLRLPVEAVVFHDGVSNVQRMVEFVMRQAEEVKSYAQMVEQARSAAEQVANTVTMIEQGAKHLADMPKGSNILDWVAITTTRSMAILSRVQWVGFQLDMTTQQFEALYKNTSMLLTPEGRELRMQQMRAARLEMSGISMQAQSIRETFAGIYQRLTTLLGASSLAEGARALQQLQMQQRALSQQQFELGLTMQAVSGRLQAMKDAEEIVLQQMSEVAAQQNAVMFMEGFHGLVYRAPGEGRGFQLPK